MLPISNMWILRPERCQKNCQNQSSAIARYDCMCGGIRGYLKVKGDNSPPPTEGGVSRTEEQDSPGPR